MDKITEAQKQYQVYIYAYNEIGVKEAAGASDNPRVVEYLKTTAIKNSHDETPWCSAFVNWCCLQAGVPGTNSARARSWLNWGVEIKPAQAETGDIVILSRGNNPLMGHVALFDSWLNGNREKIPYSADANLIYLLGGNQLDMVRKSAYPTSRVLGIRRYVELSEVGA